MPLKAPSVEKEPSLLVKPSPTSTLPRVVSAMTLAAVDEGISISTPLRPDSTFASAHRRASPTRAPCVSGGSPRTFLLWAHNHSGAVGVLDHQVRDAAHECSPHPAQAPVTHHDKARSYLLAPAGLVVFVAMLQGAAGLVVPFQGGGWGMRVLYMLGILLGLIFSQRRCSTRPSGGSAEDVMPECPAFYPEPSTLGNPSEATPDGAHEFSMGCCQVASIGDSARVQPALIPCILPAK